MSEWISVNDRLPEEGKTVLVWNNFFPPNDEYSIQSYAIARVINGEWSVQFPIAWMELPEPPKEDSDG